MALGKWAIPVAPRCHLKRHAVNRNYRNDWCEYGGKCETCPIATSYIEEGFDISTTGWIAERSLEEAEKFTDLGTAIAVKALREVIYGESET